MIHSPRLQHVMQFIIIRSHYSYRPSMIYLALLFHSRFQMYKINLSYLPCSRVGLYTPGQQFSTVFQPLKLRLHQIGLLDTSIPDEQLVSGYKWIQLVTGLHVFA